MAREVSIKRGRLLSLAFLMTAGVAVAQTTEPSVAPSVAQALAQNPEQEKTPRKAVRRQEPTGRVTVIPSESPVAPQVVTVIHRLSGVKMLRLLLSQAGQNGVVETIDPKTVNNDAHASIIAGWALDDGNTVAARLPQGVAEIEITELQDPFVNHRSALLPRTPFPFVRPRVEPDLTVVTSDGRKLRARLIGLDAQTGLSVMQVAGVLAPQTQSPILSLAEGQLVQIFAPEPAKPEGEAASFNTFVRVGKIDARIFNVGPGNAWDFEKLIVRGAQLSPDAIGGVACDQFGNTLGIVESLEGQDASIVTAKTVRAATQRVLARQASVPRPVLGVRGELVQSAKRAEFLAHGWRDEQLDDLIKGSMGILLTSVMPKTPAAQARLQAGDVIVRVNQSEIKTGEHFSKLLGQAGSGKQVEFTIMRPDASAPLSVSVTLGGSYIPEFEWRFEMPRVKTFGLRAFGIETVALTRAERGLLVVSVMPESAGAQAGVREGDVIESIDGRIADRAIGTAAPLFTGRKKHTITIVRDREKKRVVLENRE